MQTPPFVPKPSQGRSQHKPGRAESLAPHTLGIQPGAQSPSNTSIGVFPIYFHFSLPKLRQIFPGCESWTSNPVPNPHHVIQSGQKSNTSHLSESRCKCFSPQAQDAEAASEIADLYPFSHKPSNLAGFWVFFPV